MSDTRQNSFHKRPPRSIETDFQILRDGTILEMIGRAKHPRGLKFLKWDRHGSRIVKNHVDRERGLIYVPPDLSSTSASLMRLPSRLGPEVSADQLFQEIGKLIHTYVDVDQKFLVPIALSVLASWIPEKVVTAPYLIVIGPTGSGKTTLLRLLSCLCRRSLLFSNLTPAELCRLPMSCRPTLVLDEADLTPTLCRLLRAGHTQGVPAIHNGHAVDLYGPKIISARAALQDAALASRSFQVSLSPTSRNMPILDEAAMKKLSKLQRKLLRWRLANYHELGIAQIDAQGLSARMREAARTLGAPFANDAKSHAMVISALLEQDIDFRARRASDPTSFIVRALFQISHNNASGATAGDLARLASDVAQVMGEEIEFEPRAVGPSLRELGFFTTGLGNRGIGIQFTRENRAKCHQLINEYGLSAAYVTDCRLCQKYLPNLQA
jgi:energy-coupling factor transporter ATP-binding protein EcfA2